jgi:hypothetical protein
VQINKQKDTEYKMPKTKHSKEATLEKKEHKWASWKTAERIAEDHKKHHKK